MGCFSLVWFQQLFIWAIIIGAVIAVLYVVAEYVLTKLPGEFANGVGVIAKVLRIVIWALFACFVVYICFVLLSCLVSYGGGMPLFPRGH